MNNEQYSCIPLDDGMNSVVALMFYLFSSNGDLLPSRHKMFNQCWFNVGPALKIVDLRLTSIGSTYRVSWAGYISN